ncbi:MAG: transposase [Candidatus Tectimicrobiota bacterium]
MLNDLERWITKTATQHDAKTLSLLQTVPGIGTILSLMLLYAIHQLDRFPRVQDVASSCRLVQCAKASGGKRVGTSGKKSGNAPGQPYLARREQKHDTGKALRLLAPKLGRAVYCMLTRHTACDMEQLLRSSESRAREPDASLDVEGRSLTCACHGSDVTASLHAKVCLGPVSLSPRPLIGHARWLLHRR